MKAKRVSKVARGKMAKALVFRGSKERTSGGLKSDSLMRNKRGRIVSKRASANGKRRYRAIEFWTDAVMMAREALHLRGLVAINGKSLSGKALYVKAKSLSAQAKMGSSMTPHPSATDAASKGEHDVAATTLRAQSAEGGA